MNDDTALDQQADNQARLRIGAVSRLTHIPVDTLRAWERRYSVVAPQRTAGSARLYSAADVDRLRVIKQLVDAGHAIGSVAALPMEELRQLLEEHDGQASHTESDDDGIKDLLIYYEGTLPLGAEGCQRAGISRTRVHQAWSSFESAALTDRGDALLAEMATLTPERADELLRLVQRCVPRRTIVVYAFAPAPLIERLQRNGLVVIRSPLNEQQVVRELARPHHSVALLTGAPDTQAVFPVRALDDDALQELASVSSAVACECPHHLVDIVRMLLQFERYSAECEHRDTEDAALHRRLHQVTAGARAQFERALIEVADYEGIELAAKLPPLAST